MEPWLGLIAAYLFIFLARLVSVTLDVVRILLLMRGRHGLASGVGFVGVCIYLVALSQAIAGGIDDPIKVLAYAAGFATGNYFGCLIEERMALGYLSLQVIPRPELVQSLTDNLRDAGFGVTSVLGEGRSGPRTILFVALKRKDLNKAIKLVDQMRSEERRVGKDCSSRWSAYD